MFLSALDEVDSATTGMKGIGIVVPFDFAIDDELWAFVPNNITLHLTRTPAISGPINLELAELVSEEEPIITAIESLMSANPEVIIYLCTSGSYLRGVEGERSLCQTMKTVSNVEALTTSGALLKALTVLGTKSVAVGTPHDRELSDLLVDFLNESGFEVPSIKYLSLDRDIHQLDDQSILSLAESADHKMADALFLSCTGLRAAHLIPELESRLGKPVLTANQVSMWLALNLIHVTPPIPHSLFGVKLIDS